MADRNALEPVASQSTGTPPAGETSTAGSSALRLAFPGKHAGDESRTGGVRVKRALRARGQRPLCGVRGSAPSAASAALSLVHTFELSRPLWETCVRSAA